MSSVVKEMDPKYAEACSNATLFSKKGFFHDFTEELMVAVNEDNWVKEVLEKTPGDVAKIAAIKENKQVSLI